MKFLIFFFIFFSLNIFSEQIKKPYIVFIKAGAKLRIIGEEETVLHTNKGFYAKVLETDFSRRDQFKIYNNIGIAKYLVESEDVVEVDKDYALFTEEKGDKVYPLQTQFRQANKELPLESEFVFNIDSVNLGALNEFLNSDVSTVFASRYKITTQYISSFPFRTGLSLNFQSASWKDQNLTSSTLSILSIGPEIKYVIVKKDDYIFSTHFSYEFCPNYTVTSSAGKDTFSANLWNFGVQNEFETILGKFTFGADFRKHNLTFKESTRTTSALYPIEYGITSFGVNVGYIYYWDL